MGNSKMVTAAATTTMTFKKKEEVENRNDFKPLVLELLNATDSMVRRPSGFDCGHANKTKETKLDKQKKAM